MYRIRLAVPFLLMTLAVRPAPALRAAADEGVPSKDGMVVCTSAPACDAGAAVLAKGGSAVDAAVATAFALAVTHPSAGNIGGGGFMVVRAANGDVTTFDYREKAPGKSTRAMYMREGKVDISLTNQGYLAPGVPGTVRGLALAHKKFGRLPPTSAKATVGQHGGRRPHGQCHHDEKGPRTDPGHWRHGRSLPY